MKTWWSLGAMAAAVALLSTTGPAAATAPGTNGLIAYVAGGDIWVMSPGGTGSTNLTNDGAAFDDSSPAWSAGGTMIAFASSRAGNSDIFTMTANGASITNLTNSPAFDSAPAWSPDGRIAYASSPQLGDPGEIWVIDADGGNATNLTSSSAGESSPAWSPDGSQIAFVRGLPLDSGCRAEIFVINDNGGGEQRLTCEQQFSGHPSWSPDGSRIVFWVGFGTNVDIAVVAANGGALSRIVDTCCANLDPAWSPDGTRIVYSGATFEASGTYLVSADGSGPVRIADSYAGFDWQTLPDPKDADCSGSLTAADGGRILQYAAGISPNDVGGCPVMASSLEGGGSMGDVNCDGRVDGLDALDVFRILAGLPQLLSACSSIPAV